MAEATRAGDCTLARSKMVRDTDVIGMPRSAVTSSGASEP
jgi:hypothetical protein